MPQSRFKFDDDERRFVPASGRTSPAMWIRRLVVFDATDAGPSVIRSVPFRPGLNIINTARPDPTRDGAVGHDVGKTLLTRLIRYCLGETTFGRERLRQIVKQEFPDSHVAAELMIDESQWVVIRPLGAEQSTTFKAIRTDNWSEAIEEATELNLSEFKDLCLSASGLGARASGESQLILPKANRTIRWLDVLAWLARDQNCRYRRPLEWRSDYSESHTKNLSELDASVLVRALMDLLDDRESALITEHRQLLQEKADKEAEVARLTASTTQVRDFLTRRLRLDGDALTSQMFAQAAIKALDGQRDDLVGKQSEIDERWKLKSLGEELEEAKRKQIRKEGELELKAVRIATIETKLSATRNQADDAVKNAMAKQANLCNQPAGICPLKDADPKGPSHVALRKQQIEDFQAELDEEKGRLADLKIELKQLTIARDQAQAALDRALRGASDEKKRIDKDIAKIDAQKEEAQGYDADRIELEKAAESLKSQTRKVDASRDAQHGAQEQLAKRQKQFDEHLQRVFAELMLQQSEARFSIDLRGIHIVSGDEEKDSGEAIASETALAFDLAALSASICGLGTFPRFVIHDSPREGDLEPHIYARVFKFIRRLEEDCNDSISFQYIIATTTPPPDALTGNPYVRLTLDARNENGFLLKRKF